MRELTCDDPQSLEDLYRGSLVLQPDGSYAQQVVFVTAPPCADVNTLTVSGAGLAEVNATYEATSENEGRPVYTPIGSMDARSIVFFTDAWYINDGSGFGAFISETTDSQYPFDLTWSIFFTGEEPPPSVTCTP